ncbi:MAG: hypothetical protein RBT47_08585 [Anaerolineae bacterium]|jgi:hypothetical protein|nr:hypothetical protein [Anaerolineae bacterium]
MKMIRAFLVLASILIFCACDYIVLPEGWEAPVEDTSKGWVVLVTNVGKSEAGDLRIEMTIRNETGDWSALQAAEGKPAVLKSSDGKTTTCDTVFVGTGGHRLAPGFQMRGYTAGTKAEPVTQLIYVECKDAEAAAGSTLSFDYSYVTGEYNYYYQDANKVDTTAEVALDEVVTELSYPIATPVEGLIQKPGDEIIAINDTVLTLTAVERTDTGLQFGWHVVNPGEYPTYVHVGNPPVIGPEGIIYGRYQTPDLASVPIAPAGDKAEWTTEVAVPQDATGLYILLSVESKKQRLFVNYAVDITDK